MFIAAGHNFISKILIIEYLAEKDCAVQTGSKIC